MTTPWTMQALVNVEEFKAFTGREVAVIQAMYVLC